MNRFTATEAWLAALVIAAVVGGWTVLAVDPVVTDVLLDKRQAVEAWTGDPYLTQGEIIVGHGLDESGPDAPSPRSPAALVLQTLTVPFPDSTLIWLTAVANLVTVAAVFIASAQIARIDQRLAAAGFVVWVVWRFGRFVWWNVTDTSTVLIVAAWYRWYSSKVAGWLLGVAAAVKVWPVLMAVVLFMRRDTRSVGWRALLTGTTVTGVGLLIPGVSVAGTLEAMRAATAEWGSMPGFPALGLASAALVVALTGSGHHRRLGGSAIAGILLSPIAWTDYWLAALPAVGLAVRAAFESRRIRNPRGRLVHAIEPAEGE